MVWIFNWPKLSPYSEDSFCTGCQNESGQQTVLLRTPITQVFSSEGVVVNSYFYCYKHKYYILFVCVKINREPTSLAYCNELKENMVTHLD